MPAAAAMSRVPVAAKPLLRKSWAAPSISWRRRLPSLRSCAVLRGRPRGRRGGGAVTTAAGVPGARSAVLCGRAGRLASGRGGARRGGGGGGGGRAGREVGRLVRARWQAGQRKGSGAHAPGGGLHGRHDSKPAH